MKKVKLGGVGIKKNVDQRIKKIYYGDKYGIDIESELGKGTTVRMTISDRIIE